MYVYVLCMCMYVCVYVGCMQGNNPKLLLSQKWSVDYKNTPAVKAGALGL